jgi:transcriptional regulator GlxA family with amidase domain
MQRTVSIQTVREFMDRHLQEPLTVPELATRAGFSTAHFIRAFRAAFGVTPHRYLRDRRLERARELLATSALPITDVCDRVGFQSLGTFSYLFRKSTGESPSEYRARRRRNVYIPTCFIRMYRAE